VTLPPQRWLVALTEYAGVTAYTGGIGTHFASLLPAVADLGIEVDLVLFSDDDLAPRVIHGVTLVAHHRLHRMPPWAQLLLRPVLLRRQFRSRRYDRVFLPEWGGIAAALPASAPLVTNLATGIRLGDWIAGRDHRAYPRGRRLARRIQDHLETRQITRSRGVVSISRAVLDWNASNVAGLPQSSIVRNCVDVAAVRDAVVDLPESAGPSAAPVILFIGRLERRKGVLPTMRAFAELLREHPSARLLLAGSSGDSRFEPSRQQLLAFVPEQHRQQVRFLGHLESEELFREVRSATVALCPSLWEGFGNVALEVKAAGSPLVVTTGSGFDDFCTDGVDCLMVAPDDAPALADAVSRIIASPDLAETLVRGGQASVEAFQPASVAPDLVAAVERLGA